MKLRDSIQECRIGDIITPERVKADTGYTPVGKYFRVIVREAGIPMARPVVTAEPFIVPSEWVFWVRELRLEDTGSVIEVWMRTR